MEKENTNNENPKVQMIEELATLYREVPHVNHSEIDIAGHVVDLVYETEIKPVLVEKVNNVTNSVVQEKALFLSNLELERNVIPLSQTKDYPIQFDSDTLSKAPWVNMIHAWTMVLNELNTISAMQRGDAPITPEVIASIAHSLFCFTTNADGDNFNRTDGDFLSGKKYVETIRRESGTKYVNPSRHICVSEMKYILNVVKRCFPKKTD